MAQPSFEVKAPTVAVFGQMLPIEIAASPAGEVLALDLERSTTDSFSIAKAEGGNGRFRLEVLPLAIGRLEIPLYWSYTTGGSSVTLASPPLVVAVAAPPLPPGAQIQDIKAPRRARPLWWPWALAAAAILAVWRWWTHRRPARMVETAAARPDPRPAEIIAGEELSALAASDLWRRGLHKAYYARLTEILRAYLERRFDIPARRLTSAELQRHLRHAELDRPVVQMLRDVFDRADLVKFAKAVPGENWGDEDVERARETVRRTTPAPAPAEAPA